MYTQRQIKARPRPAGGISIRTLLVSFLGLLPVGVVSTMMLMDIFGVWAN